MTLFILLELCLVIFHVIYLLTNCKYKIHISRYFGFTKYVFKIFLSSDMYASSTVLIIAYFGYFNSCGLAVLS